MKSLKQLFSIAAMCVGGGLATLSAIGLLTNGWSTANELGGVDLTGVGVLFTLAGAGLAYIGYKRLKSSLKSEIALQTKNVDKEQIQTYHP